MGDGGRTSTTLDIRVNARDLNRLDRLLKQTFKPGTARDLNREFTKTVRTLNSLTRELSAVGRELRAQKGGSRVYQDMRRDMEGARKEAERLRKELDAVRRGAGIPQSGGGAGSGGGGTGGGGGGGVMRAGAGMQVPMPSAAALATALSGVPLLGAVAGGSLMASYGMYGSALRHQTARRDNFAYLGLSSRQMLGQSITQQGRSGRHVTTGDAGTVYADASEELRRRVEAKFSAGTDRYGRPTDPSGALGKVAASETLATFMRGADAIYDTGFTSSRNRALGTTARATGHDVRWEAGQATEFKYEMGVAGLSGVGQQYGVNATQALQEAGGMSKALGTRVSPGDYEAAKAFQLMFGIDLSTTGGMMREDRYAFGGGDTDNVAKMIGNAVAIGLDGSEIGEYLNGMHQMMKRQADLGQTTGDTSRLMAMQRRLSSSGLTGRMASSVGLGFAQGAAGIGMGSGGGAEEFMLMRAMGYTGTGGPEEYAKYKLLLQDPTQAIAALPGFLGQAKGIGGRGSSLEALSTQRLLQSVGVSAHGDTARSLAGGIGADPGALDVTAEGLIGQARTMSGYAVGITGIEAGMENQRIGIGYKVATQVQQLNQILINLADTAQTYAGPALELLTGQIQDLTSAARNAGGLGGGSGAGSAGGG